MRPTSYSTEGGIYNPPLFEPALISHLPFQEHQPTPPAYELPLQAEINERFLHLLGPDYTPAIAVRALRERGRLLDTAFNSVPLDRLNNEALTIEELDEIGNRSACVRITAGVLANRYGINLQEHIDRKLMNKMQVKYKPDDVTEIRAYGTIEDPGKKDGPYALASLKQTFDERTGVQHYQNRGLPIPEEESQRREPTRKFSGAFQDLANWWQVSSLGSDLVPSERVVNLVGENGEIDEVIGVLKGMSVDQINSLSRENVHDLEILEDLGDEIADVFIGSWCTDAAVGIDSDVKDKERMDIAVEKYGDGPKLRKQGVGVEKRLTYMETLHQRNKMGLKTPAPLPTIIWTGSKVESRKSRSRARRDN